MTQPEITVTQVPIDHTDRIAVDIVGPPEEPEIQVAKWDDDEEDLVHVASFTRDEALELYHALANALLATRPRPAPEDRADGRDIVAAITGRPRP